MNPPAALHGAMSRDRKPFTYTPGGLDLSEIKSSRMAARLMRNAMNEGVPEIPKQSIQSPPVQSTPIAVPNFNCLPVQVFPSFNLPANPKSLLRTRSNPSQSRDLSIQKAPTQPTQFVNNSMTSAAPQYDTCNKNTATYSKINNNRPVSMFEYGSPAHMYTPSSFGNDGYTSALPEISYEAEYFRAPPKNNASNGIFSSEPVKSSSIANPDYKSDRDTLNGANESNTSYVFSKNIVPKVANNDESVLLNIDNSQPDKYSDKIFRAEIDQKVLPSLEKAKIDDITEEVSKPKIEIEEYTVDLSRNNDVIYDTQKIQSPEKTENSDCTSSLNSEIENKETYFDTLANPAVDYSTFASETKVLMPIEDPMGADKQKKEVKVVEKQVVTKTKNSVANQNGSSEQNGDSEVEAVIKLPSKKSAAKTETKVEVTKKTLPDGSIEEVKKTITKTTIDGKTEIKTKTETTIIPKEDDEEEEEEVEEEEEEQIEAVQETPSETVVTVVKKSTEETEKPEENKQDNIIKTEERSETTTTTSKKIVVVQDDEEEKEEDEVVKEKDDVEKEEDEVEEQEFEEAEPVTFVIKQPVEKPETPQEEKPAEEPEEVVEEEEEEVEEELEETEKVEAVKEEKEVEIKEEKDDEEEVEEEEEYEEAEEKSSDPPGESKDKEDDENIEAVQQGNEDEEKQTEDKSSEETEKSAVSDTNDDKEELSQEITEEKQEVIVEKQEFKQEIPVVHEETITAKVPLREPSVPLEKVEDVEIKPIGLGDFLTKTTEKTEIITNVTDKPTGLLTEINRIENIVTVNRTTKTLDRSYEDITQQGIPTLKTYFTPHIDRIATSPLPARPYQPVYPPEPTTERRHSLLLERLSVERQMPSDIYQNNYQYSSQTEEQQRQWSQEPQAEVLTVSNVKPSQITNQQWYQQRDNAIYNNVAPSPLPTQATTPSWSQPKPQSQPLYQPQPQYHHTPSPQPTYQQPQPQYQAPQAQYQAPQPQYQSPPQLQTQYQPSYAENIHEKSSSTYQNSYSTYTPKPNNWATSTTPLSPIPTIITPSQPSQYNYLNKDSSESYQKTTQQYSSSSYVPPPWEQDSSYVPPETPQNYYQPPPQTSSFSPANNKGWKPNLPTSKFSKPPPTAYIPPKPNQSFVVPVSNVEPPKMPGRKTYYSEYERRYISVPESTYIPGDNKFQHQPDPSPAYYYDNNEPTETVEPQWRRELREFTEKSQTLTTETNVKPPWEPETKYAKASEPSYTPTPTWSQTVRPQSWRERSFESEFKSQEWPKTNTLGRGRPLSSYGKEIIQERTRGVSVDRYNPNSYQAPVAAEHPPVQTHTHVPPAPHATGYHNPNVPAYHSRASAEPREQVSYQQPRNLREARASPFQSRSFKYLQWITGTED